jgi:glycosyltransferase involved in cell wall biosynthesis
LFAVQRPIPLVIRLHTSCKEAYSLGGRTVRGPIKWDVRREHWQAGMADALVTHSKTHRHEMAEELGIDESRITVIPHGIPVFPQYRRPKKTGEELHVVFLGRLEIRKGTIDLLKAVPQVLASVPEARFVLIGKDCNHCPGNRNHAQYIRDEFPAEIQARVELLGRLPDEAVDRWLQSADVLVAPSLYESFGLVLLEAMRWETPVVATRAGAIPEIIEHGNSGILVAPQSPGKLAQAITALLRDANLRRALGQAGRRRAETRYTVQRMAREVGDLYRDLVTEWKWKKSRGWLGLRTGPRTSFARGVGRCHDESV